MIAERQNTFVIYIFSTIINIAHDVLRGGAALNLQIDVYIFGRHYDTSTFVRVHAVVDL